MHGSPDSAAHTIGAAALLAAVALASASSVFDTLPARGVPGAPVTAAATSGGDDAPRAATEDQQRALVEFAYAVASTIPVGPHRNERARAQLAAAELCIERGWLDAAFLYANAVTGWRRGEALAQLGEKHRSAGDPERARSLADAALKGLDGEPDWGRDRVHAQVAALQLRLGDEAAARSLVSVDSPAELGRFEAARTQHVPQERLAEQADMFDRAIATGNFDLVRAAVDGYMHWLERTASCAASRERALRAIDSGMAWVPLDIQIATQVRLSELLHAIGDAQGAAARFAAADKAFAESNFEAEYVVPVGATLVQSHARVGARAEAAARLRVLQARYDALREEIPALRRGASLRALGESWAALGDLAAAQAAFTLAVEEGAANPNARPRAVDLSATCTSMARAGIAPTPALMARMETLRTGLVDPW